ncbi:MAG TPA: ATP-binding protein [Galbibacter sp.]|nr:ATP-binding protein [Galbibacter sp.]HLV64075.1 ATP-binding protein [Galbibacter sp.]
MKRKLKKSYRFALRSSGIISLFVLCQLLLFQWLELSLFWMISIQTLCIFSFAFFVLQYRVERFIYRGVKKIYDDVSLLESTSFQDQPVTTNMQTLTEEIEKFAKNKKVEIETLKIREGYRKEFLGNISHELKTPLFTVQGYILTLLDGAMDDKHIRKKYLVRANKGVERLIYIVRDLDMITRLEAGDLHLELENFDIVELIQGVFDMMEMKAHKKDITLTFDTIYKEPIMVYADRERIQQVVSNLVVNSIKYSKASSTTEVSIEDLVKNKIIVRVTDNGEGIEPQNLTRLFERFYRVDKSGSRKEGGSGLGLAIVKHIIEAHKEKIYVESVYGVGSEFSFTLEKAKESAKV